MLSLGKVLITAKSYTPFTLSSGNSKELRPVCCVPDTSAHGPFEKLEPVT